MRFQTVASLMLVSAAAGAGAASLYWLTQYDLAQYDLTSSPEQRASGAEPQPSDEMPEPAPRIVDQQRSDSIAEDPIPPQSDKTRLVVPVAGVVRADLIDTWGDARSEGRSHDGIDIPAPAGTPVLAAASGVVEKLFTSDKGGLTIYVRSPDRRTIHYYAHLSAYAPRLEEGQAVAAGQKIGAVGASGNAAPDAPHLHFEILRTDPEAGWHEGEAVNPYPLLR